METLFVINENLKILIGIDGNLILKGKTDYYDITNLNYANYMLPLLEKNSDDFFLNISSIPNVNYPLLNQIIDDTIKFAFLSQMEYWSDLALNWMNDRSFNYSWLHSMDNSWMSQKLRHRVMKIWNR